jgi:hypothetical protein
MTLRPAPVVLTKFRSVPTSVLDDGSSGASGATGSFHGELGAKNCGWVLVSVDGDAPVGSRTVGPGAGVEAHKLDPGTLVVNPSTADPDAAAPAIAAPEPQLECGRRSDRLWCR